MRDVDIKLSQNSNELRPVEYLLHNHMHDMYVQSGGERFALSPLTIVLRISVDLAATICECTEYVYENDDVFAPPRLGGSLSLFEKERKICLIAPKLKICPTKTIKCSIMNTYS